MACCSVKYKGKTRLEGKTAVVTGCNTGIGKETAKDLCKRGCRVIMACRDVSKAEAAAKEIRQETSSVAGVGTVVVVCLDLSSFASVRQCAAELLRTEPQINLLINNAGLGVLPRTVSKDGYELVFAVNHLGHFLFTLLLLPRLLTSTPARIVNVSSVLHMFGSIDFDDINMEKSYSTTAAYNRSKLANVLFSQELSNRLKNRGVTTYSLHPGGVDTEINRNMDSVYCPGSEWIFKNVVSLCNKTPLQGAQTTIYCAVEEALAEHTGQYYSDCKRTNASSKARDPKLALKLWEESLKMVDLENYDPFTPLPFTFPETPAIIVSQPTPTSSIQIPVQYSSSHPVQPSDVEMPAKTPRVEIPVQNADVDKPEQTSGTKKPEPASDIDKPVQHVTVETAMPVQSSGIEKPVQNADVDNPEQTLGMKKPEPADIEKPIQNVPVGTEMPVQSSGVEKPVQNVAVGKPEQTSVTKKPEPASDIEKPVQNAAVETEILVKSSSVEKPVQNADVEKPEQTSDTKKPEPADIEKPVQNVVVGTEIPVQSSGVEKPEEKPESENAVIMTTAVVESEHIEVLEEEKK